jgi:hypothetical protein
MKESIFSSSNIGLARLLIFTNGNGDDRRGTLSYHILVIPRFIRNDIDIAAIDY